MTVWGVELVLRARTVKLLKVPPLMSQRVSPTENPAAFATENVVLPTPTSAARTVDALLRSAQNVMEVLLIYLIDFRVNQLLLEAKASEHSARMVAMKNATDNARQLVKDLTLEYNKMRQASITKELLEISSAAMALG